MRGEGGGDDGDSDYDIDYATSGSGGGGGGGGGGDSGDNDDGGGNDGDHNTVPEGGVHPLGGHEGVDVLASDIVEDEMEHGVPTVCVCVAVGE